MALERIVRSGLDRIPPDSAAYHLRLAAGERWRALVFWTRLARMLAVPGPSLRRRGDPEVIVSPTSFPARIGAAWIAIETMFRQDRPPDRIVLVLSEKEFPDRRLPERIVAQTLRGLEVLWIAETLRSYGKLLPARAAHPDADIVTIDDDHMYEPWILSELFEAKVRHPGAIIGHRGHVPVRAGDGFAPYAAWPRADAATDPDRVFLTGAGAVLYPAGVLPDDLLLDYETASRLCPTADDVWFWAAAVKAGVPRVCLNNFALIGVRLSRGTPSLYASNRLPDGNDAQIAATFAALGLTPRPRLEGRAGGP